MNNKNVNDWIIYNQNIYKCERIYDYQINTGSFKPYPDVVRLHNR